MAAEWGRLSVAQVRVAVAYYAEYREEIEPWIAENRAEARAARDAFERAREALA